MLGEVTYGVWGRYLCDLDCVIALFALQALFEPCM